jgi:hypothetical protein
MSPTEDDCGFSHTEFQALNKRVDGLEGGLAENTAMTSKIGTNVDELLNVFQSWVGAMHVLETLGRVAKPLSYIFGIGAAIAAAWASIRSGGHT